jgi:hypothetical protein
MEKEFEEKLGNNLGEGVVETVVSMENVAAEEKVEVANNLVEVVVMVVNKVNFAGVRVESNWEDFEGRVVNKLLAVVEQLVGVRVEENVEDKQVIPFDLLLVFVNNFHCMLPKNFLELKVFQTLDGMSEKHLEETMDFDRMQLMMDMLVKVDDFVEKVLEEVELNILVVLHSKDCCMDYCLLIMHLDKNQL